ncbi:hypothetical protein [Streptomyces kurssanovii]|uniref:hypothetical protein n=1 Tax=Streptomyces kurssanovii TaxID=67312 RepID=UPI003F4DC464
MAFDDVDGTLAAIGPRLRAAREHHGATLAGVSCATGIHHGRAGHPRPRAAVAAPRGFNAKELTMRTPATTAS